MQLKRVLIKNFRSLADIRIDFDPQCRALVGINESGKTNILRALSMLDSATPFSRADIRDVTPTEDPITEAYIKFIFNFSRSELSTTATNIESKMLAVNLKSPIVKISSRKNINLYQLVLMQTSAIYKVDLQSQTRSAIYYSFGEGYDVLAGWKTPSDACPPDFSVNLNGEAKIVKNFLLINTHELEIPDNYLKDIDINDVVQKIGEQIILTVNNNIPEVINWVYDDKYLLPPSINIDDFSSDPKKCIPLQNMFLLANITEIGTEIANAKAGSPRALTNLLRRVAKHTTEHFQKIWKDYKNIEFTLTLNGNNIDAGVIEENSWALNQRSDGFKRFISFLLIISAKEKSKQLANTLLVIDEPDTGLHPSGARYLKKELIRLSLNNYVVFSTHSIFMIDDLNIGRHYIVKKSHEVTSIYQAQESNLAEEEVIFNALGFSIFEILNDKNIIFEGWRDKVLFEVALDHLSKNNKTLFNKFRKIGFCFADGVNSINNFTPLLELARRSVLIISDDDQPAKLKQTQYQSGRYYGIWKRYSEIISYPNVVTGEDFLKAVYLNDIVSKVSAKFPSLTGKPVVKSRNGFMHEVLTWLKSNGIVDRSKITEITNALKDLAFLDLKAINIDGIYFKFLDSLVKRV